MNAALEHCGLRRSYPASRIYLAFLALRFAFKLVFSDRAGVNFRFFEAAIFTASPVRGLRPLRAPRSTT